MRLTFDLEELRKGIGIVRGAISRDSDLFVLTGIMVEVDAEEKVRFRATDNTTRVTCTVAATIDDSDNLAGSRGARFVLPKEFIGLIGKLRGKQVTMSYDSDKERVRISSGHNRFQLNTAPAGNFPVFPEKAGEWQYEVGQGILKGGLRRAAIAMERKKDGRPIFRGVLFDVAENISITATDTFRLVRETLVEDVDWMEEGDVVIPDTTVNLLTKLLEDSDDKLARIRIEDNSFFVELAGDMNVSINSDKLHGDFPSVTAIIPNNVNTSVVLSRKDLIDHLEMLRPISAFIVRIDIDTEEDLMYITGHATETASGTVRIPIDSSEGENPAISIEGGVLIDALKSLSVEKIRLGFTGAHGQAVVEVPGNDNYKYVYMPVRQEIAAPAEIAAKDSEEQEIQKEQDVAKGDVVDYDNEIVA